MAVTWDRLIRQSRLRPSHEPRSTYDGRTPFESDYERVVFASAFRRLDGKAQVYANAEHDFVRTRLPHSLEVSALGAAMAVSAAEYLRRHRIMLLPEPRDAGAVVATACLLHDIGNPPFGHKGEDAVKAWAKDLVGTQGTFQGASDFIHFDGNAQSFRIAVRLQNSGQPGGMNLTLATLGSIVKYPWASDRCDSLGKSKFGFFYSDHTAFEAVMAGCGLASDQRHPLSLLMEAADDLANSLSDVEDAVRYGKVDFDIIIKALETSSVPEAKALLRATKQRYDQARTDEQFPDKEAKQRAVQHLRALALGELRSSCVQEFVQNYDAIVDGAYSKTLASAMPLAPLRKLFSRIVEDHVFNDSEVVRREAEGEAAVKALLNHYLTNEPPERPRGRLAPTLAQPGLDPAYERVQRAVDYVVGMTDRYLLEEASKLNPAGA